jgi:hypothetical protein
MDNPKIFFCPGSASKPIKEMSNLSVNISDTTKTISHVLGVV